MRTGLRPAHCLGGVQNCRPTGTQLAACREGMGAAHRTIATSWWHLDLVLACPAQPTYHMQSSRQRPTLQWCAAALLTLPPVQYGSAHCARLRGGTPRGCQTSMPHLSQRTFTVGGLPPVQTRRANTLFVRAAVALCSARCGAAQKPRTRAHSALRRTTSYDK
jgi:hypothetical protein